MEFVCLAVELCVNVLIGAISCKCDNLSRLEFKREDRRYFSQTA